MPFQKLKREARVGLSVSANQKTKWEAAAALGDMTLSDFVRQTVDSAANKAIKAAKQEQDSSNEAV